MRYLLHLPQFCLASTDVIYLIPLLIRQKLNQNTLFCQMSQKGLTRKKGSITELVPINSLTSHNIWAILCSSPQNVLVSYGYAFITQNENISVFYCNLKA